MLDLDASFKFIAEKSGLMPLLYPRIYANVGAYPSPRKLAEQLCAAAEAVRIKGNDAPSSAAKVYAALRPMMDQKMPLFFVGGEFLQALKSTEFRGDVNWTELQLPYEHGVMVIPKGGFVHPTEGDLQYVLWSRLKKGEVVPVPNNYPKVTPPDTTTLIILSMYKSVALHTTLVEKESPLLQMGNLFCIPRGAPYPDVSKSEYPLSSEDQRAAEKAGSLLIGAFLALSARPDLLKKEKREGVAGKSKQEFWHPNYVGLGYKPRVFVTGNSHAHGSPRMHWRRGHIRQQVCGTGRVDRKTIWLEPCLIAAERE